MKINIVLCHLLIATVYNFFQKQKAKSTTGSRTNVEQDNKKLGHVEFHVFNWVKVMSRDVVQKVHKDFFPYLKKQMNKND